MQQTITVTQHLTAQTMGSGSLPVYATPAVVALMENTACQCLTNLPEGDTTVGIHIDVQHLKASAVGEQVSCTATMLRQEGRQFFFTIEVTDSKGNLLATATHERFLVNAERFMAKLQG